MAFSTSNRDVPLFIRQISLSRVFHAQFESPRNEELYDAELRELSALGHSLQMYSTPVSNNVRYASDSDQKADEVGCRLSATSGLLRRSRQKVYPITSSARS